MRLLRIRSRTLIASLVVACWLLYLERGLLGAIRPATTTVSDSSSSSSESSSQPKPPRTYERAQTLSRNITIVVDLSGELANNLHHIAHGVGLQRWAKERHDIDSNLILRHDTGPNSRSAKPKWKSARDDILQCFPNLQWSFTAGNNKDFQRQQYLQSQWLGPKHDELIGLINSEKPRDISAGLELLAKDIIVDPDRPAIEEGATIQLPYLLSQSLHVFPFIDDYYDHFRDMFQFNTSHCCAELPKKDESVFHFRNYQSEMPPERAYEMGFAEIDPKVASKELFSNLQSGDKVAITSRIANSKARRYVETLEERGITARLISGQTGVQDFCFLHQTSKELVGNARSTYCLWAGLLGRAQKVRLYNIDYPKVRLNSCQYKWVNAELKDRISFEVYQEPKPDR